MKSGNIDLLNREMWSLVGLVIATARYCECWRSVVSVCYHRHSVVFLKPTVSSRPSVPTGGSHKCLGFGLWLTLRTTIDLTYLFFLLLWELTVMMVLVGPCRAVQMTDVAWPKRVAVVWSVSD